MAPVAASGIKTSKYSKGEFTVRLREIQEQVNNTLLGQHNDNPEAEITTDAYREVVNAVFGQVYPDEPENDKALAFRTRLRNSVDACIEHTLLSIKIKQLFTALKAEFDMVLSEWLEGHEVPMIPKAEFGQLVSATIFNYGETHPDSQNTIVSIIDPTIDALYEANCHLIID